MTATGRDTVTVRPGRIRAWWNPQLVGDPFDWPILFNTAPANRRGRKPVLGLGGVVTTCRWTVEGPRSAFHHDGFINFEDVR